MIIQPVDGIKKFTVSDLKLKGVKVHLPFKRNSNERKAR